MHLGITFAFSGPPFPSNPLQTSKTRQSPYAFPSPLTTDRFISQQLFFPPVLQASFFSLSLLCGIRDSLGFPVWR